jgi:type I restriction enzyme S subunit
VIEDLRPYPETKLTGLSRQPEMPAHWQTRKLRHCGRIMGGMTPSMAEQSFWDGGIPWASPKDMKRHVLDSTAMTVSEAALHQTPLKLVPKRSVLIVVRGMILARRVPIARTAVDMTINQDIKAIVPCGDIDPGFLSYQLDAMQDAFIPLIDEAGHGTKRLPTTRWRELVLTVPPLDEQRLTRIIHEGSWSDRSSAPDNGIRTS